MLRTARDVWIGAGLLLSVMSAGCALQTSGLPGIDVVDPPPQVNAYACTCSCNAQPDASTTVVRHPTFNVCVPDTLNGNKPGGTPPSDLDLLEDCKRRVVSNYAEMAFQCQSLVIIDPLNDCTCAVQPATAAQSGTFVAECNDTCNADEVDCATFDARDPSSVRGTVPRGGLNDFVPVCEVASLTSSAQGVRVVAQALPTPALTPLAARIFGQRSTCAINATQSTATVTLDDDPQTAPVSGVVEFLGASCPGTGCALGMTYQLSVDPLQFSGFCAGTEISDVVVVGTVPERVALDTAGIGQVAPQKMFTSSRGTRTDSGICVTDQVLQMAFVGTNTDPVGVTVDWNQKTCAITGVLLGATVENKNALEVAVSLHGTLVNQPPVANAGADQTVECSSSTGAQITLDGTGSSDPDNDIVAALWHQGNRTGALVGTTLQVILPQGVSTTQQYVLQVIDNSDQLAEDATTVRVADTTAPNITSVQANPNVLSPPNHEMVPVTVVVSALDVCDPAPVCRLVAVSSNEPTNGTGDGNTAPDWQITGPLTVDLRAERAGKGTGRVYTVTAECRDATGNRAQSTTTVTVPH